MAGKAKIGGSIVLEGEKSYREALKGIRTEQAELRSEMKLSQSTFKDNQNSLEALTKKHEILEKQLESEKQKQAVYNKAIEDYSAKQEAAAKKIELLQTSLVEAESRMEEMKGSSDSTKEALEAQAKAVDDLKKQLGDAEKNYDSAGQKILSYQTSLNNTEAELAGMQKELDKTEAYIREAEEATDNCATSIDEYGQETQEASEQTSVFGDVLKANLISDAIVSGIKTIANGIKEIATAAVETGENFEASMSQVAATMGMTAEEIRNGSKEYTLLSDAAKECGKSTMFSASEAAEALNYLALAGYDAEKSAATLPKVLDLAAAGGLDLAYASDLVTDSMAALGMETDKLDAYIDEMARTSQKSNTSVAQLGEATLVCAGTVSLAGQSLETMNTELGILANKGIKGAEGGTHLRNIILSLSAPTDVASIAIGQLGLRIADSSGNMRDMNDIMTDLERSTSRMSSQEKTQIISKIFNKTDIAAVNALLKGTGDEYNNLYAEINNCSGAAAAMAETLNDNLKGKLTILQSALEGLGISAYEVFDDEMKGAVDSATEAVGNLQKSMENGDLGVSMRKFSRSLGELVEGAAEFGEDALPVVIDGLTWLMDNSDLVIAGVTGIAAANMQMKVVGPAINAVTAAWKAHKIATTSAAETQEVLNVAMNANPAGILVTAIVGLTAAVLAYSIANKDNCYIMDETTGATKKLVEASKELKESYASAAAERKAEREGLETEAVSCRKLVEELKELQSRTDRTASEQIRMQMIVDELNQAVPSLNLAIDKQTGLLNMSTRALEDNVDAMMALAKADAAREDLTKITEEQYEAEKQLAELEMQLEEQKQAVAEAQQRYNEKLDETNRIYGNQIELYDTMMDKEAYALDNAKNAQADLEEQIQSTKESIDGFTEEYEKTLDYIADTEGWSASGQMITALGAAAEMTGDSFSRMSDEVQAKMSEMQTSLEETIADQLDLFSEFSGEMALTTSELLSNMQSQIDGITQWSENLSTLAERGIDQGLLKKLEEMGPAGAGYVATFVQMTDEELQKANELFAQSLTLPTEAAEAAMEAYEEAGVMAAEGFVSGIEGSSEGAAKAAAQMAKDALDEMRTTLAIQSPSKETQAIGEYVDEGLETGIKEGKPNVIKTIDDICSEIIRTARNGLQTSTFQDIGRQIPTGLEAGIQAGRSGVISAVTEMCTQAIETAKSTLQIHSPSRQFEYMGEMSGEGYIGGWRRSMANINAVIASTLPDTSMGISQAGGINVSTLGSVDDRMMKKIDVAQTVNIYSLTDDLVETTRKFKQTQEELARQW